MTNKPRWGASFAARLSRTPLWQRALLVLFLLPPILAGGTAAAYYLRLHQNAETLSVDELPLFPSPEKGKRYLILAPHCDDETLAVGGFIADATRKGASVSLAFLTNGDGFPAAATRELKEMNISPSDYVRFAERRQNEASRAAKMLGVAPGDMYFLGYPDRGLRPMWETHWSASNPYRSFYTGHTHSPYPVSFTKRAAYNGAFLQGDLIRLLDKVRPTDVFVTHPADDHPDHSAAASFTQAALRLCTTEPQHHWARTAKLHYYIVHRGDWPLPQGKRPSAKLTPPPGLVTTDTAWHAYMLSDETRAIKDKALSRYVSQLNISSRFLTSFIRTNELFGEMNAPTVPQEAAGWTTVAVDGRRDDVVRYVDPSADLTAIAVQRTKSNELTVRVSLRGASVPKRLRYTLLLRDENKLRTVFLTAPESGASNTMTATVPLAATGTSCLWVAAETRYQATANLPMRPVDRIGYRPFLLPANQIATNVSKSANPGKSSAEAR
ncbi:MAG: PIG-L family deacetylase [Fibrella sp.]|nr:PIG-L family deacetylase [Armatimonadota bacterium]